MTARLMTILFLAATLTAAACKKKEEGNAPSGTAPTTTGSPTSETTTGTPTGSPSGTTTGTPTGSEPATPPTPSPTAEGAGAKLNDAQIAAIVVAANQVDIEGGKLAIKKAKHPEVKKFAERMVTDHKAVNKSAVDLVTKLKVKPEENDTSKSLLSDGEEARAKLEKLEGDAFDRAYVDHEVAYHEAVINVLKTQLIPSASNQELKDTLVGVQPAFDAHLQHAKKIQKTLADGPAAAARSQKK